MRPFVGCILSPSTRLSSLNFAQSKLGASTRTETCRADIESGDSYMQMLPPCIEAGPELGSFSFSPITASASALVTSLQAKSSALLALDVAGVALALGLIPTGPLKVSVLLQEVKFNVANKVISVANRHEPLLRRINGPSFPKGFLVSWALPTRPVFARVGQNVFLDTAGDAPKSIASATHSAPGVAYNSPDKENQVKRFVLLLLAFACTLVFSENAFSQKKGSTADPWAGTFKLDLSKSKFGGPSPKEETATVASATKDSIKYSIAGTDVNGNPYNLSFDGKADTAGQQMMNGQAVATITYHMPSPREFTSNSKGSDGSTGTGTVTLSKDGKTITVHDKNKNAQGGEQENTIIYVRQ